MHDLFPFHCHALGREHANDATRTPDTVQNAVKVAKMSAVIRAVEPGMRFLMRMHRDILAHPIFMMYSMQAAYSACSG
jgi:hypothetical protein